MNFKFYVEKLNASKNFKKFGKENKKAFPCSCLFVIDKEDEKGDKQHFDFYIPSSNKIFSIPLEENLDGTFIEIKDGKAPAKISLEHDFDFNEIEQIILERMKEEKIENKVQKILFSFQNVDGRDFLIGTIFIASYGLINLTLDIDEMKIKDFKKKSFFDMMNIFKKDK